MDPVNKSPSNIDEWLRLSQALLGKQREYIQYYAKMPAERDESVLERLKNEVEALRSAEAAARKGLNIPFGPSQ